MKPVYQSKTIAVNLITMLIALIDMGLGLTGLPSWVVALLSAINIVLRFFSNQQITIK